MVLGLLGGVLSSYLRLLVGTVSPVSRGGDPGGGTGGEAMWIYDIYILYTKRAHDIILTSSTWKYDTALLLPFLETLLPFP